jgi:hypothetical protein
MDRIIRLFARTRQFSLLAMVLSVLLIMGFSVGGKAPAALAAPLGSAAIAPQTFRARYFLAPGGDKEADRWGEITIAQPKVWQYERVNALLDGLLRDVEGVSLADLTRLDPNQQNAAAIRFVQSALGVSVQFDQAAQVNASNILQNFQIQHDSQVQQLNAFNDNMQQLTSERARLTQQLFAANNDVLRLQATKDPSEDQKQQLTAAQNRAGSLQTQLSGVNDMISKAGTAPTLTAPPTVTGTSATAPALPSQPVLGDLLKSLPDSVQKSLANGLQSPTYPATKQMDSFITLLHERLAREISVMQDDLVRDPNTFAYLVQFDVGLYPSKRSKNHMARVEFDLVNCPGCKVYSLYPGQSSYNVANYQGSSKRRSFAGNFATLIGLGISANYQRQEDALKGSLVQSVYVSGFQDDTEIDEKTSANQRFGWYYNAAPFDELVTPGIRSTFAIVTVPSRIIHYAAAHPSGAARPFPLSFVISGTWPSRDNPRSLENPIPHRVSVNLPATQDPIELPHSVTDDSQRLHVLRMEYNTVRFPKGGLSLAATPSSSPAPTSTPSPTPPIPVYSSSNGCKKDECATILLTLDVPIDPNLVVTVHGTPLHRVRDWRGRATSVLPPVQSLSDIAAPPAGAPTPKSEIVASRSLLETDQLEPNSWFAVNSHDLLLTISHDLAGEEIFPVIQISDPGKRTLVIPNDLRQNFTELIFDGFRLLPATEEAFGRYLKNNFSGSVVSTAALAADPAPFQGGPYPYSTFIPLFQSNIVGQEFYAIVGQTGEDLIIGLKQDLAEARPETPASFLESRTSAILEDADLDLAWSLSCANQGKELVCKLPMYSIRRGYEQLVQGCPKDTCPSISRLLSALRDPANNVNLSSLAFVPNLQVWVAQVDPDGKNSFWSPGPAKIGLFPLGDAFVHGRKFKPWHFDPFRTTADQFSVEACNYFGGNPDAATVQYLTPLDFPTDLVPDLLIPDNRGANCGSIPLPTLSLQYPEIVLQTSSNQSPARWTDAIPISILRPHFGRAKIELLFDRTNPGGIRTRIAGWDVRIPVNRAHCMDDVDLSKDFRKRLQQILNTATSQIGSGQVFEWLSGATAIQPGSQLLPVATPSRDDYCELSWWQRQSTGQIQLHFTISKQVLELLPPEIHLLRTNADSVSIAIAQLPDLRRLVLPSKLKVESIGEGQFALRGHNAGAIDAVMVQDGNVSKQYKTAVGVDFALVNAMVPKTVTIKDDKTKETSTSGGASDAKSQQDAKNQQQAAQSHPSAVGSGNNPQSGMAGGAAGAGNNPPGSAVKPQKTKTILVSLDSGTYTLVPLVYDGKNYIPIEVTDEQGKALTYTVPAKKDAASEKKPPEPDVTVTITKTTKKPMPTPTPTPTPTPVK